jgi:pyrroloquinoline-quinone synthase
VDFWTRIARLRRRRDVLQHPFYLRWSAGELRAPELAHYAGQYRHAVVVLADATASAAASVDPNDDPELRARLDAHAREEAEHIGLWDDFCRAVEGSTNEAPTAETLICARAWAGDNRRTLLCSLMALHAIEAGQPAIAATKRAGLIRHYGVHAGPATAYFDLHERLDVEHARASRELIEARHAAIVDEPPSGTGVGALLGEADAVLRANWLLLDGVEQNGSRGTSHRT